MENTDSFDAEFENAFLTNDDDANASPPPSQLVPQSPPQSFSLSPLDAARIADPSGPSAPLAPLTPSALSPSKPSGYFAMNAVHMEIQENAKLPTFNMTVDRSNATSGTALGGQGLGPRMRLRASSCSSIPAEGAGRDSDGVAMSPSTSADIDEMFRLSENDRNLTEIFLGEGSRSSAAAAYNSAGALLSSIGTKIGDKVAPAESSGESGVRDDAQNPASTENGKDGIASAPDSKSSKPPSLTRVLPVGRGIAHAVSAPKSSALRTEGSQADKGGASKILSDDLRDGKSSTLNQHLYKYYPYRRPVPLPIPSSVDEASKNKPGDASSSKAGGAAATAGEETTGALPTKEESIAAAIATAAAIACTQRSISASTKVGGKANSNAAKAGTNRFDPSNGVTAKEQISAKPTTIQNGDAASTPSPEVNSKAIAVTGGKDEKELPPNSAVQPSQSSSSVAPSPTHATAPSKSPSATPATTAVSGQAPAPGSHLFPYMYPPVPYPFHPYQHHHQAALAAAHSSTKASITEATKKRSQFGFGNNHVVPSVPQPPPPKKLGADGSSAAQPKQPAPLPVTSVGNAASAGDSAGKKNTVNAGPAYERKKQKAKHARAKLNDSIDRLSVAISVAGTQSQQRAAQLRSTALAPISDPSSSSCRIRTFRPATIKGMEDLTAEASAAKKWDRPSFVGTAAVLVQGLNAQCESLMREIVELNRLFRQERAHARGANAEAAPSEGVAATIESSTISETALSPRDAVSAAVSSASSNAEEITSPTTSPSSTNVAGSAHALSRTSKRRKLSSEVGTIPPECRLQEKLGQAASATEVTNIIARVLSCDAAFRTILSSLDPQSLARCRCVSRSWKDDTSFGQDGPWMDLCICRFGSANVRRWKDKEDDVDEQSTAANGADVGHSGMKLYQLMCSANIRPPCFYEGNVRLGDARIRGVAGAWVTMTERSNGETLRSVQREPGASHTSVSGFSSLPVVELRILLQNTGVADSAIIVPDQTLSVDASTRRRGEQMAEITWDKRLAKKVIMRDGSSIDCLSHKKEHGEGVKEMFRVGLFESIVFVAHFHVRGCSTTTKFRKRANFIKLLITVKGTTVPIVVPFTDEKERCDENSVDEHKHSIEEIMIQS